VAWRASLEDGFTLTSSVSSTTLLATNSSITLTLSASSPSVFQGNATLLWLFQLTPVGTNTYDSCFESISMVVSVIPTTSAEGPEIMFTLSSALSVLGFVIAIVGAWITQSIIEQMHSRIREAKPYFVWLAACPIALTMCAIWPCLLITMSAMQVSTYSYLPWSRRRD
jgi:hypothetical protein